MSSSGSPRSGVAARERADQRQVALHQLLARGRVAVLVVAAQQLAVLARAAAARRPRAHLYRASSQLLEPHDDLAVGGLLDPERVDDGVEDRAAGSARPAGVLALQRLGDRRSRAAGRRACASPPSPSSNESSTPALGARLREQALDRQLEVVHRPRSRSPPARRCRRRSAARPGRKSPSSGAYELDRAQSSGAAIGRPSPPRGRRPSGRPPDPGPAPRHLAPARARCACAPPAARRPSTARSAAR